MTGPLTRARIAELARDVDNSQPVVREDLRALLAVASLCASLAEELCRCWPSPQAGVVACHSCRARALVTP